MQAARHEQICASDARPEGGKASDLVTADQAPRFARRRANAYSREAPGPFTCALTAYSTCGKEASVMRAGSR